MFNDAMIFAFQNFRSGIWVRVVVRFESGQNSETIEWYLDRLEYIVKNMRCLLSASGILSLHSVDMPMF